MISQALQGHYCRRGDAVIRSLGVRKETGVTQRKIATTRRPNRPSDRIERARVDKFSARRIELAEGCRWEPWLSSAMRGPACARSRRNPNLRTACCTITSATKVDLICCCVRHYKAKCVTRLRPDHVSGAKPRRTDAGFSGKAWRDGSRRGPDASPLVRPSLAVSV